MANGRRKVGMWALFPALVGCGPGADGDWAGVCGDGVRLELHVRASDPEARTTGRAWVLARPDDALEFRCTADASGREIALTDCIGGWITTGEDVPLDVAVRAEVESGDGADALAGACTWEGQEAEASLIRIAPAPPRNTN